MKWGVVGNKVYKPQTSLGNKPWAESSFKRPVWPASVTLLAVSYLSFNFAQHVWWRVR